MKRQFHVSFTVVALASLISFASCKKEVAASSTTPSTPLYAMLIGDTSVSFFNAAVQKAGDNSLFHGTDSVTVFMPTNAAFLAQGITSTAISAMSATALDSLVRYHFISSAADLTTGSYTSFNSLLGPALYGYGNTDGSNNYFNGSIGIKTTLSGSNAIVYKLSAPLQIPAVSIAQLLSTDTSLAYFSEALNHTGISLIPGSGWNTVLAPDNNSFIAAGYPTIASIDTANASSLTTILQYHILPGQYFSNGFTGLSTVGSSEGNMINLGFSNGLVQFTGTGNTTTASVTQADRIAGTNIIVQKINGLLIP